VLYSPKEKRFAELADCAGFDRVSPDGTAVSRQRPGDRKEWARQLDERDAFQAVFVGLEISGDQEILPVSLAEFNLGGDLEGACELWDALPGGKAFAGFDLIDHGLPVEDHII